MPKRVVPNTGRLSTNRSKESELQSLYILLGAIFIIVAIATGTILFFVLSGIV